MKTKTLLIVGVVGIVAWYLYNKYKACTVQQGSIVSDNINNYESVTGQSPFWPL